MTATPADDPADTARRRRWFTRIAWAAVAVGALAATYLLLAAFIPRWWAQRIADLSGHGSFARGMSAGLALGALCTGIPLLLLLWAVLIWRRRGGRFLAGAASLLALIVALPNLMTLTIVLGTTGAAHAADRVLDVTAPGFRGATAVGAIGAAVVAAAVAVAAVLRRRRGRTGAR